MPFDLWKKEGVLSVLIGLLALAAGSYHFLFAPALREIRGLKEEIARKESESAEATALRAAVAASRAGGKEWDRRILTWEERIPDAPETDRLLSEIAGRAVLHRLESFVLSPVELSSEPAAEGAGGAPGNKERLPEARYRMTFRSTYRDLANFLDDIPRMRRLLSVRSVSIKGEEGAMTATVELSAWHRRTR